MSRSVLYPRLRDGGTIAIVAPAGHIPVDGLRAAERHFADRGHTVRVMCTPGQRARFTSGPDSERAAAIMAAFRDPGVDAVFSARGGYGSGRLLDRLDFAGIAANPKPFIGFSDCTALQLALLARAQLVSFTGTSVFPEFRDGEPDALIAATLWPLLQGQAIEVGCAEVLRPGQARGPLVGGCLSLVVSLIGTGYMPDLTGAVLLLEDVNEEPFRVDRMLTQLRHAGVFSDIAGLVFGRFRGCKPKDEADGAVADVLSEAADRVDGPVVGGVPYGHELPRCVLPVGATVALDTAVQERVLSVPSGG